MSGWIKLHRQFLNWEWYDDAPVKTLFLHLLLKANYTAKNWHGIAINRGQYLTSLPKLSSEAGLSHKQTRGALEKLKRTKEVTVEGTQYSLITLCKYETYQSESDNEGTVEGTTGAQSGHGEGTVGADEGQQLKKVKKDNNEKKVRNTLDDDFDVFWSRTRFPKRPQDAKGAIKKKYLSVIKNSYLTMEQILFASDVFAEAHKNDQYPIGLRRFMELDTIKQYLDGDIVVTKTTTEINAETAKEALKLLGGN